MIHPVTYITASIISNTFLLWATNRGFRGSLLTDIPMFLVGKQQLMYTVFSIACFIQIGLFILSIMYFGLCMGAFAFAAFYFSAIISIGVLGQYHWFSLFICPVIEPILIWQTINHIPN